MAEVLITHSYFLHFDPKQWRAQKPYPPLASLYAASVLRNIGCDVGFYDTMFAGSTKDFEIALEREKPSYVIICDDGFNYLTKMCLLNMREAAFEMIRMARDFGCTIVMSSSDATDHSEEYLNTGADFIVVGEVENTLVELMEKLLAKDEVSAVNGLRYLDQGSVRKTPHRENRRTLDEVPFPAWDMLDIVPYKERWVGHHGYFSINMVTTRGCPFKCNWCAKPIYGNRYNSRSPKNVVDELLLLKQKFGIEHVWFCDDIFGLKPNWISEFSSLVRENGLRIRYKIQSRADLLLMENSVRDLAASGCEEVWMGVESGSQKILDAMDKGITIEQVYNATNLMKEQGIQPCFFLQFGYPGENAEDIRSTLGLLSDLMPHDIGVSVSYPLPGTKFFENVKSQIEGKTNWRDSDDLVTLFNGTFPSGFYKKLQRYVHRDFRKKQAIQSWKQGRNMLKALSLIYRFPQAQLAKQGIKKYVFHD